MMHSTIFDILGDEEDMLDWFASRLLFIYNMNEAIMQVRFEVPRQNILTDYTN